MAKRLWLTILLAVLIPGVGHMYLGFIKRGIILLIFALVLSFASSILMPFPLSSIIPIGYMIWQIYDAYVHYKRLNVGRTQVNQ